MLLARETELGLLCEAFESVAGSGGRVVVVRGEAGIGKTLLVSQFIAELDSPAQAFVGFCDDLDPPEPFGPFRDIADHAPPLEAALIDANRRRVVDAMLEMMSADEPRIVWIEDTQWADQATLEVLTAVARRVTQTNGLLVLTYRDSEVDYDHPMRTVVASVPSDRILRITLQPVSREQANLIAGGRVSDVDRLMKLTEGNPLFIAEIAASGLDKIPVSIKDAVASQLGKLPERQRWLFELLSVSPGGLSSHALDQVGLDSALPIARRTGWLRDVVDGVEFRHELIRRAVEVMTPRTKRREAHRLILEVLVANEATPARIAFHAARAGDDSILGEYGRIAAFEAMNSESFREALAHFQSLEPFLEEMREQDRIEVLENWAICAFTINDPSSVRIQERLVEVHRKASQQTGLPRALSQAVRLYQTSRQPEKARRVADEALTLTEGSGGPERAMALSQSAWLSLMHGDAGRAGREAAEAVALARALGDIPVLVQALGTLGSGSLHPNGGVLLDEAGRLAASHELWFEQGRALINRAQESLSEMRDLIGAEQRAREAVAIAEQHKLETLRTFASSQLATILFYEGKWEESEELAYSVLGSNAQTDATSLTRIGAIQLRRGNKRAESTLISAQEVARDLGELQHRAAIAAAWVELCWLLGKSPNPDIEECEVAMVEAADNGLDSTAERIAAWLYQLPRGSNKHEHWRRVESLAQRALEEWLESEAPYDRAIAQLVTRRGDVRSAIETLEILGAGAMAARHRQLLRADGMSVPRGRARQTREHPAGLTQRQAEVLVLLAEDLTNEQIAERLFLSLRTVEKHVSAVLGKLAAVSRREAVDVAREMKLIP